MARLGAHRGRTVQVSATRSNGWTKARRTAFLQELIGTCNVEAACRAATMSDSAAYQLRRRDGEFRALWNEALEQGYARLEMELMGRAIGRSRDPDNDIDLDALTEAASGAVSDRARDFDVELAFRLLAQMRAAEVAGRRGGAPAYRQGNAEDTDRELERRLTAMEKQLARTGRLQIGPLRIGAPEMGEPETGEEA